MKANKLIRNLALACIFAGLYAGTANAEAEANYEAEFKATIEKAEDARKKASAVGGEWRDTGKVIKKAEVAAKKGDYGTALKLANDAYRQGELGYQQAMSQKGAGFPSYLH